MHLQRVKKLLPKQSATMASESYGPWKCRDCRRLCKATAQFCPSCGTDWSQCADNSYIHDQRSNDWSWENPQQWNGPTPGWSSPRTRSASGRRRSKPSRQSERKGKGKGKEKSSETPKEGVQSRNQYALPPAPLPWIGDAETTATTSAASATPPHNPHSEVLSALKKMYPDPAQMPSELRAAVEKTEAQSSKQVTRDLHSATSQLGRAKKSLADSKEARSKHRKAWFTYLAECATVWKEQQVAFSEREQLLRAQEEKSRLEIVQITSQIQQLTNKNVAESGLGATSPAIPPVEAQEGQEDEVEEKKLKEAAQVALQLCLTSVKEETETIMVESDKDDPEGANPPAKRPRSVDPNGGHGLPSAAGGT